MSDFVSILLLKLSLISSPKFTEYLYDHFFWTHYWVDCLSLFCLVIFLMFCLILSFGIDSFVFSPCLNFCICFYVLGCRLCLLILKLVALWRRHHEGPRSTITPGYQNQVLQGCLFCRLCVPYYCDWAGTAVGMLVGGAGPWPSLLQCTAMTTAMVLVGRDGLWHSWLRGLAVTTAGVLVGRVRSWCGHLWGLL